MGITTLAGNLVVHSIQASGLVTLVAASGSILPGGGLPLNVTATSLEVQAATGIGSSGTPLSTVVQKLEAVGGSGGVFIANTGNLQIGGISQSLLGLTGLSASGSDIVLVVTGTLTTVEAIAFETDAS